MDRVIGFVKTTYVTPRLECVVAVVQGHVGRSVDLCDWKRVDVRLGALNAEAR